MVFRKIWIHLEVAIVVNVQVTDEDLSTLDGTEFLRGERFMTADAGIAVSLRASAGNRSRDVT